MGEEALSCQNIYGKERLWVYFTEEQGIDGGYVVYVFSRNIEDLEVV